MHATTVLDRPVSGEDRNTCRTIRRLYHLNSGPLLKGQLKQMWCGSTRTCDRLFYVKAAGLLTQDCKFCEGVKEDPDHLFTKCPQWDDLRDQDYHDACKDQRPFTKLLGILPEPNWILERRKYLVAVVARAACSDDLPTHFSCTFHDGGCDNMTNKDINFAGVGWLVLSDLDDHRAFLSILPGLDQSSDRAEVFSLLLFTRQLWLREIDISKMIACRDALPAVYRPGAASASAGGAGCASGPVPPRAQISFGLGTLEGRSMCRPQGVSQDRFQRFQEAISQDVNSAVHDDHLIQLRCIIDCLWVRDIFQAIVDGRLTAPINAAHEDLWEEMLKCWTLLRHRYSCTAIWVPSHTGNAGNEIADSLATRAQKKNCSDFLLQSASPEPLEQRYNLAVWKIAKIQGVNLTILNRRRIVMLDHIPLEVPATQVAEEQFDVQLCARTLQVHDSPAQHITDEIMAMPRFATTGLVTVTYEFCLRPIMDGESNRILGMRNKMAMFDYFDQLSWTEGGATAFELIVDFAAYTGLRPWARGAAHFKKLIRPQGMDCSDWNISFLANLSAFHKLTVGQAFPDRDKPSHMTKFGLPKQASGLALRPIWRRPRAVARCLAWLATIVHPNRFWTGWKIPWHLVYDLDYTINPAHIDLNALD